MARYSSEGLCPSILLSEGLVNKSRDNLLCKGVQLNSPRWWLLGSECRLSTRALTLLFPAAHGCFVISVCSVPCALRDCFTLAIDSSEGQMDNAFEHQLKEIDFCLRCFYRVIFRVV